MNDDVEITVKVNLVHGDPISYKARRTTSERRNMGSRIEAALNSNYLGVELGGELTIVPLQNIQSIVISPAPDVLIKSVIRDVEPA